LIKKIFEFVAIRCQFHIFQFRLGLRPRPHWGSLQRSPDLLARFKGPASEWGWEGGGTAEGRTGNER